MIILAWIVIGLVAGYLANLVVGKGRGYSPLEMLIGGLVGSFVGGTLFSLLLGEGFNVRIGGFRPRFVPTSQTNSWLSLRRDVTSAKPTTESDCASVPGQAQIRRAQHVQSSRCHGGTPVRRRCVGRCAQRAHSL